MFLPRVWLTHVNYCGSSNRAVRRRPTAADCNSPKARAALRRRRTAYTPKSYHRTGPLAGPKPDRVERKQKNRSKTKKILLCYTKYKFCPYICIRKILNRTKISCIMKETINVNIAQQAFTMDMDAYSALTAYLDASRAACPNRMPRRWPTSRVAWPRYSASGFRRP